MKNKTKSNLRLIFSSISLVAFMLFSLCSNLIVTEHTSYYTYGWRLGLMNDLFLLIPFIALFIFAVLERKLEHVNGRLYVFGLFVLYAVQALFIFFGNSTSDFSIFTCSFLGSVSDITIAIMIVRIVMLFLIPIAHKIILKIYSIGMIALMVLMLVGFLSTDSFYFHYISHSISGITIAIVIDALFHIALFFFSDLLSKENAVNFWRCLSDGISYHIFENLLDEEYDDFEYDADMESIGLTIQKNNQLEEDVTMSKYYEYFSDDALRHINTFDIGAEDFLLDPPENAVLHYELERQEEKTAVSGRFTYTFTEEQAARILKKKSVLNKTFEDISLCALSDTDIGVESIEEGTFTILLEKRTFDISNNFDGIRNYMLRFMETIILIQNTESYE